MKLSLTCLFSTMHQNAPKIKIIAVISLVAISISLGGFRKKMCWQKYVISTHFTGHALFLSGTLKFWGACPACTLRKNTNFRPVNHSGFDNGKLTKQSLLEYDQITVMTTVMLGNITNLKKTPNRSWFADFSCSFHRIFLLMVWPSHDFKLNQCF